MKLIYIYIYIIYMKLWMISCRAKNHICCRAPLAGVGEDWVEIVIPHQVSSFTLNRTERIKSSTKFTQLLLCSNIFIS